MKGPCTMFSRLLAVPLWLAAVAAFPGVISTTSGYVGGGKKNPR